ncbi:MAG: hypothetical protein Q8R02_05465 [Hyphomonadaceae bacterium]|nr:hypothetical protein [Hyphomonadaceae bacterium]
MTDPKDKRRKLDEELDKALEESFPASDPPTVFGDTSDERGDEAEEDDGTRKP